MPIIAIVAEYNPFHNGHLYMIEKIKKLYKDSIIIVIMSGSFTQRGEVAILDKWTRARLATLFGVDVVFELPFAYATNSGEFFAKGAVKILNKLNAVDFLAFGAETDNLPLIYDIAESMNNEKIQAKIHNKVQSGFSYAQSLTETLKDNFDADILKKPNNILGIEYIRALKKFNSRIKPILIERKSSEHNSQNFNQNFASASAIRGELKKFSPDFSALKQATPAETFQELQNNEKLCFNERLFRPLLLKIYTNTINNLQNIYGIGEGLENRIIKMAKISTSINEFIDNVSSKRYPKSRISRVFSHILTDFTKDEADYIENNESLYARLLAFNSNGKKILSVIKRNSEIAIIEKTSRFIKEDMLYKDFKKLTPLEACLAKDILATNVQTLALKIPKGAGADFTTSPIYIL